MAEGKEAEEELNRVFPEDLLKAAAAKEYFGGEFDFKSLFEFPVLLLGLRQ